jgi:hypothetical protein
MHSRLDEASKLKAAGARTLVVATATVPRLNVCPRTIAAQTRTAPRQATLFTNNAAAAEGWIFADVRKRGVREEKIIGILIGNVVDNVVVMRRKKNGEENAKKKELVIPKTIRPAWRTIRLMRLRR